MFANSYSRMKRTNVVLLHIKDRWYRNGMLGQNEFLTYIYTNDKFIASKYLLMLWSRRISLSIAQPLVSSALVHSRLTKLYTRIPFKQNENVSHIVLLVYT